MGYLVFYGFKPDNITAALEHYHPITGQPADWFLHGILAEGEIKKCKSLEDAVEAWGNMIDEILIDPFVYEESYAKMKQREVDTLSKQILEYGEFPNGEDFAILSATDLLTELLYFVVCKDPK